MKKYIYSSIIFAILVFSCRKVQDGFIDKKVNVFGNSFNSVTHSNVILEGNYLHFENLSAFQVILDGLDTASEFELNNWEGYFSGYQSMRTYYEDLEEVTEVDTFLCPLFDESLATVVNNEGIVAVDSVAFLLDFSDNSVYEVYPVNEATIDSLRLKNEINNDSIYLFKYSMDYAVFFPDSFVQQDRIVLKDGRSFPANNSKRAFRWLKKLFNRSKCNETYAKSDKDMELYSYQDPDDECINYRYKMKLKYQRTGIRFCIQAKVKHQKKEGCSGHWRKDPGGACFDGDMSAKVFCGNWINTSMVCFYNPGSGPAPSSNNFSSTTYKQIHYKSWNSLSDYEDIGIFMLYDVAKDTVIWSRQFEIERPN